MEWVALVIAVEAPTTPATDGSADSVTVALIATLGTVVIALIGLGSTWISKTAKPPDPGAVNAIDPKIGERAAVLERLVSDDRTVLDVIDRRLDRAEDDIERLAWRIDQMTARPTAPPPP